ncbi:mobilization protein [Streptomyces rubiginosohelvolus]|uniref:mobilization protein n=1 Tax=Streptomyces rubiginosohelvolus TaxID=67362 RepID=UPI0034191808
MPKKAGSGECTADLLAYLFGPGNHEEHTDPHLVAAWTPGLPCPARTPDRMTLSDLALLLDAPVDALRGPKPAEHVWHVSVRNEPDDRVLSDTEWATVAAEMVAAAGIAPHGDAQACRWVAVRHVDDHIHLVATLARQDGRHPRIRGDIPRMHTAARAFETAWGLTPMSLLDRTARRAPVTGEREKAARRGLTESARESLQRTVREAAARATTTTTDFLTRLRDAGLRVREHCDENGAQPGDRADRGTRPVWFSGRTLAYDLSLPRIRERFHPVVAPADLARAHTRIREAAHLLTRAGRAEGAGDVAALGDLLVVAAATSLTPVRDQIRAAAAAFEQASRAPRHPHPPRRRPRPLQSLRPSSGTRTESSPWRRGTRGPGAPDRARRSRRGGHRLAPRTGARRPDPGRRPGRRPALRSRHPHRHPATHPQLPAVPGRAAHRTGDTCPDAWPRHGSARYRCTSPTAQRTAPGPGTRIRTGTVALKG